MDKTRQEVFEQLVRAGAVVSVALLTVDGFAVVEFVTQDGSTGNVFTKRGDVKHYRVETALRLLRSLGFSSVRVALDTSASDLVQALLPGIAA